jgi:glucose dehydrogenase
MNTSRLNCWVWWILLGIILLGVNCVAHAQSPPDTGWPNYGNDAGGGRYSTAAQINRDNVAQLKLAWTYRTGAMDVQTELNHKAAFEATPILTDGKLFLSTPYDHVIALDPVSGKKIWEFDPKLDLTHGYSEVTSRGVSAWRRVGENRRLMRPEDFHRHVGCATDCTRWTDGRALCGFWGAGTS